MEWFVSIEIFIFGEVYLLTLSHERGQLNVVWWFDGSCKTATQNRCLVQRLSVLVARFIQQRRAVHALILLSDHIDKLRLLIQIIIGGGLCQIPLRDSGHKTRTIVVRRRTTDDTVLAQDDLRLRSFSTRMELQQIFEQFCSSQI